MSSFKNKEVIENQEDKLNENINEVNIQDEVKIEEEPDVYTFIEPLIVGRNESGDFKRLSKIKFREPTAGDLRGLALMKVYESDVDSWITLLNRITIPNVDKEFLLRMSIADMSKLIAKALTFLLRKA